MTALNRRFGRLASDRRGGVAVTVAITSVGLIGIFALSIDVSSAISAQARLRAAADSAALTAVRQAAIDTAQNSDASLVPAQDAGADRFRAQAGAIVNVAAPAAAVQVFRNGLTITANVIYNASYSTQVSGALSGLSASYGQMATIPLSGSTAAQQTVGAFVDIQVLMDTSNSMAIAATATDASLLSYLTWIFPMWTGPNSGYGWQNCTVACHATLTNGPAAWGQGQYKIAPFWNYYDYPPLYGSSEYQTPAGFVQNPSGYTPANASTYDPTLYDFYALARWGGVTLRLDLLKSAVGSIATAVAAAPDANKFRFGFYTFDLGVVQQFGLGAASAVTTQVSTIDATSFPGGYPGPNYWVTPAQTNVGQSIQAFTDTYVAPAGDGSSPDQAQKFVIIMTDGVEDYNDGGGRETAVFDPGSCAKLKESPSLGNGGRGAGVFVLQAASLDNFFTNNGQDPQTFFNASVAAMQTCASDPSYYFLASSPADIAAATQSIVNLALSKPTILTAVVSTIGVTDASASGTATGVANQ